MAVEQISQDTRLYIDESQKNKSLKFTIVPHIIPFTFWFKYFEEKSGKEKGPPRI